MQEVDVIQLSKMSLSLLQYQQQVMAENISGLKNEKLEVNFSKLLSSMQGLDAATSNKLIQEVQANMAKVSAEHTSELKNETFSLDEEVAKSVIVAGKYKTLVEGMNRKIDLLRTAIGGRG